MARVYAYASTSDVQLHVAVATFTASSRPNLTQVGQFINDAANELDAKFTALNYTTPVATGATQAGDLLRTWNGIGAAYYAVMALPQGDAGKHLAPLERRWTAILTSLDDGGVTLPGVSTDSTTGRIRSAAVDPTYGGSPYWVRGVIDG